MPPPSPDVVHDASIADHAPSPSVAGAARPRVLECKDVERRFGGLVALTGVDLHINQGEIFGLVGPNGSGKTTMTNAITGFYPPQKGQILLNGREITGMAPHAVARQGVARTFQNLALFNGMTVLDNILLGRHVHMRPSVMRTMLYPWLSRDEEIEHRRVVEDIIDFMQLQGVRDELVDALRGIEDAEHRPVTFEGAGLIVGDLLRLKGHDSRFSRHAGSLGACLPDA